MHIDRIWTCTSVSCLPAGLSMDFNHKGHCLFYQTQLPLCVYLFRHECIKVFNIHHPSSNCHFLHQYSIDSCMNAASFRSFFMVPEVGLAPTRPYNVPTDFESVESANFSIPGYASERSRTSIPFGIRIWIWHVYPFASLKLVHLRGFEPPCLSALPPQGSVYSSSTTSAYTIISVGANHEFKHKLVPVAGLEPARHKLGGGF